MILMALRKVLNVTDSDFGVSSLSQLDQTLSIVAALGYLGKAHPSGILYSKTAYFPSGTYYISATLLDLMLANNDVIDITLRGDGPSATVLKIYNFVDFVTQSQLDDFNGGGWTATSAPALDIAAHGSAGGPYDSNSVEIKSGRFAKLRYKRNIASGMTLKVLRDGVLLATDSGPVTGYQERTITFTTGTESGTYDLSFRLEDPGTGSGTAVSIKDIHISESLYGAVPSLQTIFKITGTGTEGPGDPIKNAKFFRIKDMTLDGSMQFDTDDGSVLDGTKRPTQWFAFNRVSQIRMDDLQIVNTYGNGIYGTEWSDSVLHNVSFDNVGRADTLTSAVGLAAYGTPSIRTGCTNLKFEACRWEGSQYISCLLNEYAREIFFIGCKWHGKLLGEDGHPADLAVPQIQILANATGASFIGCRMANWSDTHLQATDAFNVLVSGSAISGADGYGIKLVGCNGCAIVGNGFPAGAESPNELGDVYASGGFGNFIDFNGGTPAGRLILKDEFATGTTSSGAIGDLGWTLANDGTASTTAAIAGPTEDHPGVVKLTCSSATGVSGMLLGGSPGTMIEPADLFDLIFVLKFDNVGSTVGYSFGLRTQGAATLDPIDGIYFKKGKAATNWYGRCISGSSSTDTTAVAAANTTNWHTFRIRRLLETRIGFSIDGGDELLVEGDIPTTGLNPFFVFDSDTSPKDVYVDLFTLSRLRKDRF
jgi:hypothetical protein